MINEPTITKLNELKLTSMAESYRNQLQDSSFKDLSFEERFGLIIDTEWSRRKNNKLTRLIRKSEFSLNDACLKT
jgi:hypothetical protein